KNLLKETEQNIFKIGVKSGGKGLVNPKLPFNLNSVDGAIIISSILHDGGIATTLNPYYFNSDKKIRRKVYNAMSNVFGDIYSAANPKKERLLFPKIIGIVLVNCIGLKSGNKVVTNLEIPHFIMDADEIIRGAFLKQAFDDEGCISRNEIYLSLSANVTCISKMFRKKILKNKLLKYSSEIFKGDKKLLESFGISINNIVVDQTSFIKDNKLHLRHRWKLCITTKKNLEIFFSKINFDIDYKKIRLRKLIEKYTRYEKTKFLPTEALIKTLKIFCEIEEKYGYLSSPIIKENFNRSDATICLRLNQFKDMGMLKIVNQNSLNTKAYIYKTTTNARKIIIDASKK
ncbi:MAG: hypothetical protein KKI14_00730, partial [Nanoarchaeota archaeon]|nr:hypothetical protein [Nanoarchaeota archaeon]